MKWINGYKSGPKPVYIRNGKYIAYESTCTCTFRGCLIVSREFERCAWVWVWVCCLCIRYTHTNGVARQTYHNKMIGLLSLSTMTSKFGSTNFFSRCVVLLLLLLLSFCLCLFLYFLLSIRRTPSLSYLSLSQWKAPRHTVKHNCTSILSPDSFTLQQSAST